VTVRDDIQPQRAPPRRCAIVHAGGNMYGVSGTSAIPNAMQSAQLGIGRALTSLAQDSQQVAQSVTGGSAGNGGSSALIDALQQGLAIAASTRVLATANQTLGTLIDVFA
jgi:hypothetical protein